MPDDSESALPDHAGLSPLLAEHDGQPGSGQVSREDQESGRNRYPDPDRHTLVEEGRVVEKQTIRNPYPRKQYEYIRELRVVLIFCQDNRANGGKPIY